MYVLNTRRHADREEEQIEINIQHQCIAEQKFLYENQYKHLNVTCGESWHYD